jgi:hypothetical protein
MDCWCYKNKEGWIQDIAIRGYTCDIVWNNDGSIFCWLCMLDEYDADAPIHHTIAPMHTNEEFIHHIMFGHVGKPISEYSSRLPYVPQPLSYERRKTKVQE